MRLRNYRGDRNIADKAKLPTQKPMDCVCLLDNLCICWGKEIAKCKREECQKVDDKTKP